ncbi:MAG: hypothetical protein JKY55_12895 [Aliivibrio sp.]|uniref:hypothetical protein n=1 Tax=Aliivibrio sp. TaxID=1872443 RepID=UPI001A5D8348|nr:hypothetical protein [Aliivibrio sp.]
MLFWTPNITSHFRNWLDSTTEQVLCCELSPWNGISSSEFEGMLSNNSGYSCIPLSANEKHVDDIIETIWQHVAPNDKLIDGFLKKIVSFRHDELRKQIYSSSQPDLGIYDCVDLLSQLETETLLCIRVSDSVPTYLMPWVKYLVSTTNIKVILLHTKTIRKIVQFNELQRIALPELSKKCVAGACQDAVYKLTGKHIPQSELNIALANSHSLNEFISIVQTATLSQCTISSLRFPYQLVPEKKYTLTTVTS